MDLVSCFFDAATSFGGGAGNLVTNKQQVTFERWARWSGTSMAAPLLAAAVAVLMQGSDLERPAPDALVELLERFCTPGKGPVSQARCLDLKLIKQVRTDTGAI